MFFKNLKTATRRIATRVSAKIRHIGRKERANPELVLKVAQLQAELDMVRRECEEAARIRVESEQAAQEAEAELTADDHNVAGFAEINTDLKQVELQISKEHRAQAVLRQEIANALAKKEELDNRLRLAKEREECYRASLRRDADVYELYTHYIAEAEDGWVKVNQAIDCLKSEIYNHKSRKAEAAWLDRFTDKRESGCRPATPSSIAGSCGCDCDYDY
ncbi:hypothetical protein LPJ78_001647 [Coemansia sp. RSA 989]|nr:hypothetical protein BX667DRAFT_295466 [Coemansia mojavensis]KAJ1743319.1 hypothetical protein LPJ68_001113 [Coemansia sp. RSA 1086]KAJ1752965.1 hypothetical protein LPJ79_000787 [Coemansia sp. RSA 1821]KAJ1866696.1 hypothetical protein LPJ78_001647 [Coemansia sp. RSA 989]KAJ1875481.1 hypothetical protein LPJ55_000646 [Coemansia sp. RSA 990]KAJ2674945.1 hypothetical protein IWW42_001447 [Coemansia sp. RSA 1085]